MYLPFCCALGLFLLPSVSGQAQEWTRFRGPNGTGFSISVGGKKQSAHGINHPMR